MSSEIPAKTLEAGIKKILEGADLAQLTSKKVRSALQEKFQVDFTNRKKEIDAILMKLVEEATSQNQEDNNDSVSSSESSKNEDSSAESDDEVKPTKSRAVRNSTKNSTSRKRPNINSKSASRNKKAKDDTDSKEEKVKKKTGFGREMMLSAQLAELVGTEKLSRGDVVKKMYAVIKERQLHDPTNKQYVICDEELLKIFGVKRFRAFGMMKHLKGHIKDPKDII